MFDFVLLVGGISLLFIGFCAWLAYKWVEHDKKCEEAAHARGNYWSPYIGEYSLDDIGPPPDSEHSTSKDDTALIASITLINLGNI